MLLGSSSSSNAQIDLWKHTGNNVPAAGPERHPIPRDRATAPSPTHTAALAIPGERTGVAAKLVERRFFKVAFPETAINHYILLVNRGSKTGRQMFYI